MALFRCAVAAGVCLNRSIDNMNLNELVLHVGLIKDMCEKTGIRTDSVDVLFVNHVGSIGDKELLRIDLPVSNVQVLNKKIYLYHSTSFQQMQTIAKSIKEASV